MRKMTFVCLFTLGMFISCGKTTQSNSTVRETAIIEANVDENMNQSEIEKFTSMYSELLSFISKKDFKQLGLGVGSPYNDWLKRAESFSKNANIQHFAPLGFIPEDLISLAYIYVSTKGADNEASTILKNAIDIGLAKAAGNDTKDQEVVLPKTDVETIIGHWKTSGGLNYDIKIIKRDNQYFSIENNKTVKLTLKGDKYFLDNSKTGEYYKIVNGKIRFYDKDGDFTDLFKIIVVILN